MHLNILSSVAALHNNQELFHLLHSMCDLNQFVVLSIMTDTKTEELSKAFME